LVILLQLNKIRLVIPQIIAVELFNDDSYAAWIFSTYSLGGVIGTPYPSFHPLFVSLLICVC
jgi:hypothetical protein